MQRSIDLLAALALGAAGAFWFSYYFWGIQKAATAAQLFTLVWMPAILGKAWMERKVSNG